MRAKRFAATLGIAAALTLSSCAAPSYDDETRDGLRAHVAAVAEASAAGDWAGALAGLDAMASALSKAKDEGKVSEERFDTIALAMELVRQDLDEAIAAAADEAERQRLLEEQARLQEQINQLQEQQNQGNDDKGEEGGGKGEDDKKGENDKKDDGD
jgi:uncharacterized membrane protein YccC